MTKKISKEIRQRIHEPHGQSSSVKDILSIQETMDLIKNIVKEETQKVLSKINHDTTEGNDKLDLIIK